MTLGPDDLVLCSGTMRAASLREMCEAAVAGGFAAITLWPEDYDRARAEGLSDADMRAMLADAGLVVADLDPLLAWLPGEDEVAGFGGSEEQFYAIHEALGARSLNLCQVSANEVDVDAAAEAFAGVCDRARERGLLVTLEFLPWSGIPDVATAHEIVKRAGRDNGTIMFDTWHHFRGPRDDAQLRAVPGASIGSVQINDAPLVQGDDLVIETLEHRRVPGDGDIPLVDWIRILDDIGSVAPIGVEVFSQDLDALRPTEAARRCGDAARTILRRARRRDGH